MRVLLLRRRRISEMAAPRWLLALYFRGPRAWIRHVGYDPYNTVDSVEAFLRA